MRSVSDIRRDLTRLDCKKQQLTGVRFDPIMNQYEIWIAGVIKAEVPAEGGRESLNKAYERVFGLPEGSTIL